MPQYKTIARIETIKGGSNPDIDTDFGVDIREQVLDYVKGKYGQDNVCNIVTFQMMGAKSAFKNICTIYSIPPATANKISSLIPDPIEGKQCTFADMYNPKSDFYENSADFRNAVEGSEWESVIIGAKSIEGRKKTTGVHACGVLISSQPLKQVIPLMRRRSDDLLISQWTYQDCEALGLIKMDFLGLDTIDIIQNTVRYIQKGGKPAPDIPAIQAGPMDDKRVYRLFAQGHTIGVFQFGSELVRGLLPKIRPDRFDDLVATTALARPGPMGVNSHIAFAERKNDPSKIEPIHPELAGHKELDEILAPTYGLIVFQEQLVQISNIIAGMSLQEGDKLRKAMGKKDEALMTSMMPRFISGGMERGLSEASLMKLWEHMAYFAGYGFNKSHSVAYAMNSYATAWLKTYYPVEFMAAIIAQRLDKKEETLDYLRECSRMRLKVGTPDVNHSQALTAPDFEGTTKYDILLGLSNLKSVSRENAQRIVHQRQSGGPFTSVPDFVKRCKDFAGKTILESLAFSGAFDSLCDNRLAVVKAIPALLEDARKSETLGESLFDIFDSQQAKELDSSIINTSGLDYPYIERVRLEADVVGLTVNQHPLSRVPKGVGNTVLLSQMLKRGKAGKGRHFRVLASVVETSVKRSRRSKSVSVYLSDGDSYLKASLSPALVSRLDKHVAIGQARKLMNTSKRLDEQRTELLADPGIVPMPPIETNIPYVCTINYNPRRDPAYAAQVVDMRPLTLGRNGQLPTRLRLCLNSKRFKGYNNDNARLKAAQTYGIKLAKSLAKAKPGDSEIMLAYYADIQDSPANKSLLEGLELAALVGKGRAEMNVRGQMESAPSQSRADLVDGLAYEGTGLMCAPDASVSVSLDKYLGFENYDYGFSKEES